MKANRFANLPKYSKINLALKKAIKCMKSQTEMCETRAIKVQSTSDNSSVCAPRYNKSAGFEDYFIAYTRQVSVSNCLSQRHFQNTFEASYGSSEKRYLHMTFLQKSGFWSYISQLS